MKSILIVGAGGYIGTNVKRYLMEYNAKAGAEIYRVDTLSLRQPDWENYDFAPYDTILHMAGKAHADIGRVSEEEKEEYYDVNCKLAVRTAAKAKEQGVPQFVYLSSVIVYGESAGIGQKKQIRRDTEAAPANFYGDSKWQAEKELQMLAETGSTAFCVAIVRSPMVYGRGSKGNFPLLLRLAGKMPVFPDISNERSMIYIENLAEFLRLLLDSGQGGIYMPQNAEYAVTAEMVKEIGAVLGKKVRLVKGLNPLVRLAGKLPGKIGGMANKAFGSLTVDREFGAKDMTSASGKNAKPIEGYRIYDLQESIRRSVEKK